MDVQRDRRVFHLLLVEDNSDLAGVLTNLLILKGYSVTRAKNGAQALRIMKIDGPPDLVMTDLHMPGGDGWTLREKMLEDENLRSVPVIVISAHTPRSLEAVTYFQKPVPFHLLVDAIEADLAPEMLPTGNFYKKAPRKRGSESASPNGGAAGPAHSGGRFH